MKQEKKIMEIKEVLLAAKQIVLDGWTQYGLTNGRGAYCLRAAIGLACGAYVIIDGRVTSPRLDFGTAKVNELQDYTLALRTDTRITELVKHVLPAGHDSIPTFNDDPETTRQDVLDVLDEAIRFEDAAAKVWAS
jgi:hypothetical protein